MASKQPPRDSRKPAITMKTEARKPGQRPEPAPRKRPATPRLKPLYTDWAMI